MSSLIFTKLWKAREYFRTEKKKKHEHYSKEKEVLFSEHNSLCYTKRMSKKPFLKRKWEEKNHFFIFNLCYMKVCLICSPFWAIITHNIPRVGYQLEMYLVTNNRIKRSLNTWGLIFLMLQKEPRVLESKVGIAVLWCHYGPKLLLTFCSAFFCVWL